MPITRSRFGLSGKGKPLRYTKRWGTTSLPARRLTRRDVGKVKRLNTPEMKFFGVSATGQTTGNDYTGTILPLSDITQGDDISNKQGRSINPKRLWFRLAWRPASWGAGDYAQLRVIIFQDMQNTGADPQVGDLLETVGSSLSVLSDYDTQFKQGRRFKILYDRCKTQFYTKECVQFFCNRAMSGKIDSTGSASTANGKGVLYVMVMSDQPPSVGNLSTYDYFSRLYFTDQ